MDFALLKPEVPVGVPQTGKRTSGWWGDSSPLHFGWRRAGSLGRDLPFHFTFGLEKFGMLNQQSSQPLV
jgi:hypothetical protein